MAIPNSITPISTNELLENDLVLQAAIQALRIYVDSNKNVELIRANSSSIDYIEEDIVVINETIATLQSLIQANYERSIQNVLDIIDIKNVDAEQTIKINNNIRDIDNLQVAQTGLRSDVNDLLTLVASDNLDLDTIQEIVDFIEANRETLETLDIDSIFGLRAVLNNILGDIGNIQSTLTSNDPALDTIQEIVDYIKADHYYLYNFDFNNIPGLNDRLDGMDSRIDGVEAQVALSSSRIDGFAASIEGNANALAILQGQNELSRGDYQYETTYTKGYTSFGYKSGTAYADCHVTNHSTDVTTRVVGVHDKPGAYLCGSYDDLHQYSYGIGASYLGSYNQTSILDYATVTGRIGTYLPKIGNKGGAISNRKTFAWIAGFEATNTSTWNKKIKHLYANDTFTYETFLDTNDAWTGSTCYFNSSTSGFYLTGQSVTAGRSAGKLKSYSTSFSSGISFFVDWPASAFTTPSAKALNTYFDIVYISAGNGGGGKMFKVDIPTLTHILTTSPPGTTAGIAEDNWQTGNEAGYTIGGYVDSVQSNRAFKMTFRTESMAELGAASRSKTAGTSSGYASAATL